MDIRKKLVLINTYRESNPLPCPNGKDHQSLLPKLDSSKANDQIALYCLTCDFYTIPGLKFYEELISALSSLVDSAHTV